MINQLFRSLTIVIHNSYFISDTVSVLNTQLSVVPKIKFNWIKGIFRALFTCSVMIFLNSCQNDPVMFALTTNEPAKGIEIVEKLTDQLILTKIALEANNSDIRMAAISKITDQSMLAKVVENEEAENFDCQDSALSKITDQSILGNIAIENRYTGIRNKATSKITDYNILVKIALEDKQVETRIIALERLTDLNLITKLAAEKEDEKIQLLYKFISGFNSVPKANRNHLMLSIIRDIDYLSSPEFSDEIGKIISINTFWSPTKANYTNNLSLDGEDFECIVLFKNLPKPIKRSWHSNFPFQVSSGTIYLFYAADIKEGDLLELVLDLLSQDILSKIANNNQYWFVCAAAVEKLTDQTLLKKIAVENRNNDIRGDAVRKLTDQTLLSKIAVNDSTEGVRIAAVEKLNDKTLLKKIAIEDKNNSVREAAQSRIDWLH